MKKIWAWMEGTPLGRALELLLFVGSIVGCMVPYAPHLLFGVGMTTAYQTPLIIRLLVVVAFGVGTWGLVLCGVLLIVLAILETFFYIAHGPSVGTDCRGPG